MIKQELISKLHEAGMNCKQLKYYDTHFGKGYKDGITYAIYLAKQLDEPEKLYTVEIPNPNRTTEPIIYLARGEGGKIFLNSRFVYESKNWKNRPYAQLTEQEIKQDFGWAWKFAKEVKE